MTQTWQTEYHDREITNPARPLVLQKILPQVQSVIVKTWFPTRWSHCCVKSADGRVSSYLVARDKMTLLYLARVYLTMHKISSLHNSLHHKHFTTNQTLKQILRMSSESGFLACAGLLACISIVSAWIGRMGRGVLVNLPYMRDRAGRQEADNARFLG